MLHCYWTTHNGYEPAYCWAESEVDMREILLKAGSPGRPIVENSIRIKPCPDMDNSTYMNGKKPKRGWFVLPEFVDYVKKVSSIW